MAPQAKKAPSPGYCRWCCSCCCTGFSIWCIIFGLSWPAALDNKLQAAIYQNGIAAKAEKDYTGVTVSNRKHNLAGVFLKYHYFNITNPVGVMNGDAPKIVKLGPYTFQKYVVERDIRYFGGPSKKKIRGSRKIGELEFMQGFSCGTCRLSDKIVSGQNLLAMWWNGRNCKGDKAATGKGDGDAEAFTHCWRIAKYGLFEPHSIEQLIWGYKDFGAFVLRGNNGHNICPGHLKTCQDAAVLKQYNLKGQYGSFPDGKRIKENIELSGYNDEGCMLPLEYKRHGKICTKGMSLGRASKNWRIGQVNWPPQVDVDMEGKKGPAFDYEMYKREVQKGNCPLWKDKNQICTDSYEDWWKSTTTDTWQWYDDTPFDTSDDKALDKGFKMDDATKPCKWDTSTNNMPGCPHMAHTHQFGLGHGLWHPGRMDNKDNPNLPTWSGVHARNMELKFMRNNLHHGIKGKQYKLAEKHYKGSHENAKYGMPASGAAYEDFPGTGSFPVAKLFGIPLIWSRPHMLGGGAEAQKWNKEYGLRLPNANTDEWSITYEPVTGLPVTGQLQYQLNTMYLPSNMKIHSGNMSTPVEYDYANLTLASGYFAGETIDLSKIGAYRNCGGWGGMTGCPIFLPHYTMKIEINFSPTVLEKIKKLVNALKGIGTLKTLMRFWMYGGITGIVCVASCLAYHYFGSGKR